MDEILFNNLNELQSVGPYKCLHTDTKTTHRILGFQSAFCPSAIPLCLSDDTRIQLSK